MRIDGLQEFLAWIATSAETGDFVFRGESRIFERLQSSIDRILKDENCESHRLDQERALIDAFHNAALRYLGRIERDHFSRLNDDRVIPLTVMQHFGAPTRLLDWTHSAAVAAYFACIEDWSSDGVIWRLNSKALEKSVDRHWHVWGFQRLYEKLGLRLDQIKDRPYGLSENALRQIDYNDHIFKPTCEPFVSAVHLSIPFPRAQAQRGLFTIGSRLGMSQNEWLSERLHDDEFCKIVIPKRLKVEIIAYLNRLGVDAISLQHAGADRIGLKMSCDKCTN